MHKSECWSFFLLDVLLFFLPDKVCHVLLEGNLATLTAGGDDLHGGVFLTPVGALDHLVKVGKQCGNNGLAVCKKI